MVWGKSFQKNLESQVFFILLIDISISLFRLVLKSSSHMYEWFHGRAISLELSKLLSLLTVNSQLFVSVGFDLLPKYLVGSREPISVASSWLSNWRICIPFIAQLFRNQSNMDHVNSAVNQRHLLYIPGDIHECANDFDSVCNRILGRAFGWMLLRQHIQLHRQRGANPLSKLQYGSNNDWSIFRGGLCWIVGNTNSQCDMQNANT